MVKAAIGLDGVDVSAIDIDKVLRLDVSSVGDEQKAQLAKQYKDFVDEYDRLKAKFTTYETVGSGMNVHTVTTTDTNALSKAISPMLAKYQDAIQYNAILVKKSDEWLQNLINVATAAEAAGRNLSSMTKAANRASQSGIGGKTPKEEPKEGSIAWYDTQIAEQNKKLIAETDMHARSAIQATINELESKRINLKFVVEGEKTFKLPKFESPIKKKDVKLNEQYAESLGYIGNAFGTMGQVAAQFNNDGMAFALNSIGSIAQMIVQLQGLATANGVASAMSLPFPANLAAIATVVGTVTGIFASLPKFATGGIVPGTSFTGDKVPALLNSGEMVLNGSQQSNLFQMLNSGLYGSLSQKIAPSIENQGVRLYSDVEIRGDRIFLALHNHIKKTGKKLW